MSVGYSRVVGWRRCVNAFIELTVFGRLPLPTFRYSVGAKGKRGRCGDHRKHEVAADDAEERASNAENVAPECCWFALGQFSELTISVTIRPPPLAFHAAADAESAIRI